MKVHLKTNVNAFRGKGNKWNKDKMVRRIAILKDNHQFDDGC